MPNAVVDQFLKALERVEQAGDVEAMVGLFADDCRIGNAAAPDALMQGTEAVRESRGDGIGQLAPERVVPTELAAPGHVDSIQLVEVCP